ncbi:MAG: DUF5611 family protein [Methanobacteriota archaeon]
MRDYDLKRGFAKGLAEDGLRGIAEGVFGSATVQDGKVVASFGALERLVAWTDGKRLYVDTTMKAGVPDAIATDTIKAYNRFLEQATGLSAKERGTRARQEAKEGLG